MLHASSGARRRVVPAALLALAVLVAASCSGDAGSDDATDASVAPDPVCGYHFEWTSAWEFPLQPDPHAAYSYVAPRVTEDPIGFVISGSFPYASWTSWTIYDSEAQPHSLATDHAITPDDGSVNPFVEGTPVLSPERDFTLLVLPDGTDPGTIDASLRDIPAENVLSSPTSGAAYVIANRVYDAFPGYNRGGAGGETDTAFPTVRAVDYETGEDVDCGEQNVLPRPTPPTDMPTDPVDEDPSEAEVALADGTRLPLGPQGSWRGAAGEDGSALDGAEYAPELDPTLIEFTRPPLLPGADVSSIPPPDECAGYLGAATSTTQVGLIRMPHVAEWFDTSDLTDTTPFTQEETTYISFTQYGSGISVHDPGSPDTGSLGNEELLVDATGGSTIVVWPPSLSPEEQAQVVAHARENGWAILRGGQEGPVTTPNLLVRLKGSSPSYPGGYTPTDDREGVPCYFDQDPDAAWSDLTGDEYVASAANIGAGAPQGVNCSVAEVLSDECRSRLEAHIADTGGSYTATG